MACRVSHALGAPFAARHAALPAGRNTPPYNQWINSAGERFGAAGTSGRCRAASAWPAGRPGGRPTASSSPRRPCAVSSTSSESADPAAVELNRPERGAGASAGASAGGGPSVPETPQAQAEPVDPPSGSPASGAAAAASSQLAEGPHTATQGVSADSSDQPVSAGPPKSIEEILARQEASAAEELRRPPPDVALVHRTAAGRGFSHSWATSFSSIACSADT